MNQEPLVLTFDCGTQSIRALLFNQKGEILAKEQKAFLPYYSLKPGYAEQKPEVYEEALREVSLAIHEKHPDLTPRIIAVTITTIRDTCVCLDENGKPLRDIIVWLDQRQAKCQNPMPTLSRLAFTVAGMKEAIEDQRKITKSNWLIENEPELWAKTAKYVMFSTYMVSLLVGKIIDSSASQIGHIPYDFKNKVWYAENHFKYPIFNVSPNKLAPIVEPGTTLGFITPEASKRFGIAEGLPLIATGSDKGCETLGTGVVDSSMASLSFGTTATIQTTTRKYVEPVQFMPAYPGVFPGTYNPEIQIYRGYWMVSWFKKEFAEKEVRDAKAMGVAPEELLNQRLKEVPPGCDGLMLQPYWAPLLKSPEARGAIIGFSGDHTRTHIYRAIIEGIGYGLLEGMRHLEKRLKAPIKALTVSGGGSQSDEICQITADMFNRPVHKIQTYEACGLGSSLVAFVSMGIYKDYPEAVKHMVHYTKTYEPNPDVHRIYNRLYNRIYARIYSSLKPLYRELRHFDNDKENEHVK
jgi:sugar (pentulose or hexulose) kinase